MGLDDPTRPTYEPATAIIPAFNEARRLPMLLESLSGAAGLAQIIVVDDASTDGTTELVQLLRARDPRLHVLRHPTNRGKAAAMVTGGHASLYDLVVFLDADLIGLRPEHVDDLLRPVRQGRCEMTLGIFRGGRRQTDWSHRLSPFLSGQRGLRWSLFRDIPGLESVGSGVEVALNLYARRRGYRVERVTLSGVTHVMKSEKLGLLKGHWAYYAMYVEIAKFILQRMFRTEPASPERSRVPSSKSEA